MSEPTIPELLDFAFEILPENRAGLMSLDWPDEVEGQGKCIGHLAGIALNPEMGWHTQIWAYDKLKEIAREYQQLGDPSLIPDQMLMWSFLVFSDAVVRPKRPPGRDPEINLMRDGLIPLTVELLYRYQGYKKQEAIKLVAEATSLSVEAVRTILKKESKSERESSAARLDKGFERLWGVNKPTPLFT